MKIQTIRNPNFKGLYTNTTKENGGNWRVEYRPYSWEVNKHGDFGMSPLREIDILDSRLPDNEKIYHSVEKNKSHGASKIKSISHSDILGTEFYSADFDTQIVRRDITPMPSMNREESLAIQSKKFDKFIEQKKTLKKEMEFDFYDINKEILEADKNYQSNSANSKLGYFARDNSKDYYGNECDIYHSKMAQKSQELYSNTEKYIALINSIEKVTEMKKNIQDEITRLREARENGLLIDISRRDVCEPNKPLKDALQNIKKALFMTLALPHKTVLLKELLAETAFCPNCKDISQKIIEHVESMIKKDLLIKRI